MLHFEAFWCHPPSVQLGIFGLILNLATTVNLVSLVMNAYELTMQAKLLKIIREKNKRSNSIFTYKYITMFTMDTEHVKNVSPNDNTINFKIKPATMMMSCTVCVKLFEMKVDYGFNLHTRLKCQRQSLGKSIALYSQRCAGP